MIQVVKCPRPITEREFMAQVIQAARVLGWLVYHTHNSMHSAAGFPDLVLCRGDWCIFVELKSEKGQLTKEQEQWLAALKEAGMAVMVWRPSDWKLIEETLR